MRLKEVEPTKEMKALVESVYASNPPNDHSESWRCVHRKVLDGYYRPDFDDEPSKHISWAIDVRRSLLSKGERTVNSLKITYQTTSFYLTSDGIYLVEKDEDEASD